jgi:putative two-component system hydrogenase maturation factor HypX/HoxX
VIRELLDIEDRLLVSAMHGNAGAGGVILGLAADRVWAREGVVLNPHYQGMGGLYGSEYWTYLLPRRVGDARAQALVTQLLPVSALDALDMQLIDEVFPEMLDAFQDRVRAAATSLAHGPEYDAMLTAKRQRRARDEQTKSLNAYREEELEHMRRNFYGEDPSYHEARRAFVYQTKPAATPRHLARHRC